MELFSERYQPTGGLAAEGVLNQLGRPNTEPLEVLVREAVQNCWDARRGGGTVRVEIGCSTISGEPLDHLRRNVLPDPPPALPLAECLDESVQLLHFADFGTLGLGGPTRADAETGDGSDFVDFVRNVGQPPDREFGGGSFGYGKAAFYLASRAGTIIVDTYCVREEERRLIACGLGSHHRIGGVPYTGRHWWGVVEDGVPEPLRGAAAADMAARLGLPPRQATDHGTTVVIVAPRLARASDEDAELEPRAALDFIAECLLWNFWPKLTAAGGEDPAMAFRLCEDGDEIRVPDPRTHPRLAPFTVAMDVLRDGTADAPADPFSLRRDLHCRSPRKRVGTIGLRRMATTAAAEDSAPLTRGAQITAAGIHHVALMRNAELVVDYLTGPVESVSGRGYAGVFRCDPELDEVFRRSEPPTHDEWRPETLPDALERRFVNTVPRRIGELLRGLTSPGHGDGGAASVAIPVGRFADDLAGLMPAVPGPGARKAPLGDGNQADPTPGGIGSGEGGTADGNGRGPSITGVEAPALRRDEDGRTRIRTGFTLDTADAETALDARVEVMTVDGGQVEGEPPIGGVVPEVLRWNDPAGNGRDGTATVAAATDSGEWEVWVAHHRDVMVRVVIEARAIDG